MQKNTPTLRYAHAPKSLNSEKCPFSGVTVSYVRTEDDIMFVYALCLKEDQYDKKLGRDATLKTWKKLIEVMPNDDPENIIFFDNFNRCGRINIDAVIDAFKVQNYFSDQFLSGMTLFDFKHAYLSKIVVEMVSELAVYSKYPESRV